MRVCARPPPSPSQLNPGQMQREIDEANFEVRLLDHEDDIIRIQVGRL